ncbi:hypothetical protein HDV05_008227, partial [Chytridiales sp. JEL 0842]
MYGAYYLLLHVLFFLNNCRSFYGVYIAYKSAKIYSTTNWYAKFIQEAASQSDLHFDHVEHLIILPNYKEDMGTLCETLDVLASHSRALKSYKVCLAMEESEGPAAVEKAHQLISMYSPLFKDITFTIHPVGRPNEIRGKSSNVSWASKEMYLRTIASIQPTNNNNNHSHPSQVDALEEERKRVVERQILTVMDADTCFAEDYFGSVTYHYCVARRVERAVMMFAPCTVFDRNSNSVPVFVRVTDMFWSIG